MSCEGNNEGGRTWDVLLNAIWMGEPEVESLFWNIEEIALFELGGRERSRKVWTSGVQYVCRGIKDFQTVGQRE